jgi:hypothetical protein
VTVYPSIQKQIDQIAANAREAFAHHKIEVRLDQGLFRNWRCAKPGTGYYCFNVSTEPGRLFVTGDVGTMVWEREPDMIPWARGAIHSIDYFASKVPGEIRTHQWECDVAADWLDAEKKELQAAFALDGDPRTPKRLEAVENLREWLEERPDEASFNQSLFDSGLVTDCNFPRLHCWTPSFLWCREAVAWLLGKLDKEGKVIAC